MIRRLWVVIISLCFVGVLTLGTYAQQATTSDSSQGQNVIQASSNTPSAPAEAATFTGKVASVSSGNSISGANPQITVKDDQGLGTTFIVASDAAIIGKDGSAITLDWVSKDNKVAIEYITAQDSTKTAKSIKVLSSW